jgi:hypothetical protein
MLGLRLFFSIEMNVESTIIVNFATKVLDFLKASYS